MFNASRKGKEALGMVRNLYQHDHKFKCKPPCTKNSYSTKLLHDGRNTFPYTEVSITFDKTVALAKTKFTSNAETVLTGFGGAVSSGRTFLWILVSLLGVSKVIHFLKVY